MAPEFSRMYAPMADFSSPMGAGGGGSEALASSSMTTEADFGFAPPSPPAPPCAGGCLPACCGGCCCGVAWARALAAASARAKRVETAMRMRWVIVLLEGEGAFEVAGFRGGGL